MAPRSEEQFQKIREEKQEQILLAALEEFSEHGYHHTSMSKIAASAGISKGLIYNYFPSKDELLAAVFIDGMKFMGEFIQPLMNEEMTDELFEEVITKTLDSLERNKNFYRLYFSMYFHKDIMEKLRSNLDDVMGEYMNKMAVYYENHGSKDPMVDALFASMIMDGLAIMYVASPFDIPMEAMKERAKNIILYQLVNYKKR